MTDRLWVHANKEAERQMASPGQWVVATVEPGFGWPTQAQLVKHEGIEFILMPQSDDTFRNSAIALEVNRHDLSRETGRKTIMRFCSTLSWSKSSDLTILAWGAGDRPRPIGVPLNRVSTSFLDTRDLPYPTDDRERAALALFREGVSLDNPFYSFLSLYKVISVLVPRGRERGEWIAQGLIRLDSETAIRRRDELAASGEDVGVYLRDEGRNAVAHAEAEPYANPDDIDDHFRLTQDLPLLRNLAELVVEEKTGLRRPSSVRREHKYCLSGFKTIFPPEFIAAMTRQQEPDINALELPNRLTLIARRGPSLWRLDHLVPQRIEAQNGVLALLLITDDEALALRLELDFPSERLNFDPLVHMAFESNRNDAARLRLEIQVLEFQMGILLNGCLEVWEPDQFFLLGQTSAYLPHNFRVNYGEYERLIGELRTALAALEEQL